MKKTVRVICHHEYGIPEEVAQVETWDTPAIGQNQVLVEMKASPINPADINILEGKYPVRSPLPGGCGKRRRRCHRANRQCGLQS